MLKRLAVPALIALAALVASESSAAAQQTINFTAGYFVPKGEDARVDGDVLHANRNFLAFDLKDFNGGTVGAEWLVPLGNFFEAGAGVSFSRRTVPSVYRDYTNNDNSEIEQDLRLRIVPVAFTVRVLPLGNHNPVQPYFGAGLGVFNWRYSETGDFIDFSAGRTVFHESYVASGNATGPVALGGIRFAADNFSVGGEVRFQSAKGDLNSDFAGNKIDLGGWTYQATFGLRFP
jgi:hypothetical protein